MKASELRIGNWVSYNGVPFQIRDGEDIDDQARFNCSQPIPLTEEWLIKFNLDFNGMSTWYLPNRHHITVRDLELTSEFVYRVPGTSLVSIKFVHQLQNLYYALTGEELNIKQ